MEGIIIDKNRQAHSSGVLQGKLLNNFSRRAVNLSVDRTAKNTYYIFLPPHQGGGAIAPVAPPPVSATDV